MPPPPRPELCSASATAERASLGFGVRLGLGLAGTVRMPVVPSAKSFEVALAKSLRKMVWLGVGVELGLE